jgi:putative transposase
MKYQFMREHSTEFSLKRMSSVFDVSRSGYYQFIKVGLSNREKENMRLLTKIKAIHADSRQTYGSPRIHAVLGHQEETCSRKRVARLMKQAGLQAKMRKRYKLTTQANPAACVAPNLLQQDFTAEVPNQRWVTDITFIATAEGWLYVAAVLDLFSRRIVGLAMSERMTVDLVLNALNQAVIHRQPTEGLTHHSDKGSQYTSKDFQKQLKAYCMVVMITRPWKVFFIRLKQNILILSITQHANRPNKVFLNMWKCFIIVSAYIQHWGIALQWRLKRSGNRKFLFGVSTKRLQDQLLYIAEAKNSLKWLRTNW